MASAVLSRGLVLLVLLIGGCREADLAERGLFQGVVELEERVLAFEVAGRVEEVSVARGDTLAAGASIARIDDSLPRLEQAAREAELRAARAELDLLRAGARPEEVRSLASQVDAAKAVDGQLETNLARERELHARRVTPQSVIDDLEAQWTRARAERHALEQKLAIAKKGARPQEIDSAAARVEALAIAAKVGQAIIDRHVLHARHPGVVLDLHIEPDELAMHGTPVVTLGDTARPYVDVFVPEGEIARVRIGATAELRVDAVEALLAGRVEHIADHAEFTPRFLFSARERPNIVFRVRVRVDDPDRKLYAGLPAFVSVGGGIP